MLKVIRLCLLLSIVFCCSGTDQVIEDTTLVFAFMIFRHGDRTPVERTIDFTTDPEAVLKASLPYGFGQLTNVGKRNSYSLGKTIRERYNKLLSPQYNQSELYLRSTDSTRTKMTALLTMAAVYPAEKGSWSRKINWTPVPYTTVPSQYDYNQALFSCPTLTEKIEPLFMENTPRMAKYSSVYDTIAEVKDFKMLVGSTAPGIIYGIYDALYSQISLDVSLDSRIEVIYSEIEAAANEAIDIVFGNEDIVNLQAGVLLNEFFIYANLTISGEDTPRVRIYSAHDANVYSFMAASQIYPRQGVPKYNSLFSLELRKINGSEKYVVLAVYQPCPGENLIYLPIKGCNSLLCDINTFKNIVSKFLLDEDTWRTQCAFNPNLDIDESGIN